MAYTGPWLNSNLITMADLLTAFISVPVYHGKFVIQTQRVGEISSEIHTLIYLFFPFLFHRSKKRKCALCVKGLSLRMDSL